MEFNRFLNRLEDTIRKIKDIRMNIYASERQQNDNEFKTARSFVKIKYVSSTVKKIYLKNPEKGLEILYNPENSHKALVKPHVFPYIPLWLDPRGSVMRKNQHYTIHDLGFDFILLAIKMSMMRDKDFVKHIQWASSVTINHYDCMVMIYENPDFGYMEHVVDEKENLDLLCLRLCINHYLVRIHNDLYNDYRPVKKGMCLKIPKFYCKKAVIGFDKKTLLPVVISLYDEKGMFEHYEYTNIRINTSIPDEEFTKDYKEYGF
jgi:hypothetical protein